jgi:hypothetical protein
MLCKFSLYLTCAQGLNISCLALPQILTRLVFIQPNNSKQLPVSRYLTRSIRKYQKYILGRNLKFLVPWPKLYRLSEIENLSKRKTGFKVHLNFAYY